MTKLQANICLLAATFFWSVEIILYKMIPAGVPGFAVTCICNLIAAVALGAAFWPKVKAKPSKKMLFRMLVLSVLNLSYNILVLIFFTGLPTLEATFALSLTTVILPVVLLVLRRRSEKKLFVCSGMMLVGICIGLGLSFTWESIRLFFVLLLPMALRAVYIVKQNDAAKDYEPVQVQVFVSLGVSLLSFVLWSVEQPGTFLTLDYSGSLVAGLFAYSYFVCIFAGALNIAANRYSSPQDASMIYSFEILMTVLMAITLPTVLGERETIALRTIVGCGLVTASAILVEVKWKKRRKV